MGCVAFVLLFFFGGFLGFFGVSTSMIAPPPVAEPAVVITTVPLPTLAIVEATPTSMPSEGASAYADVPQTRTEDGAYVLGFDDAPITIVAFEDFLCPHCQAYQTTLHPFIEQYVLTGQAKFEFRMLATQQISNVVMGLAQCAEDSRPGTFWDAHDLLFELASEVDQFDETTVFQFADELNVDTADLAPCAMNTTQHQTDQQLAAGLGVNSTPTVMVRYADGDLVFLPDTRVPSLEELAAIVEAAQ